MCVTFFYINRRNLRNSYRLILINNRDEFYNRKTKSAGFWAENENVLGGRDLDSDVHGTWLAASRKGKIANLLNVHTISLKEDAQSRGRLVADFVKQTETTLQYCENLSKKANEYNEFHLLLFDITPSDIVATIQSNVDERISTPREFDNGKAHGVGNYRMELVSKKVSWGEEKFNDIINKLNSVEQKNVLIEKLLDLLKSEERNHPDPAFQEGELNTMKKLYSENFSSVFVKTPLNIYGTRTHTIILIYENEIDFNEFTMKEPIDGENPEWLHNHFLVDLTY